LSISGKRVYRVESVYDNMVVVLKGNWHLTNSYQGAGLPLQKATRFHRSRDRDRYHKNAIINKDMSPLVGIVWFSLLELVLLTAETR